MTQVKAFNRSDVGKKTELVEIQIGKWYKFNYTCIGEAMAQYGKVVKIDEDGTIWAEKVFELPSYRPYAATKWYDNLPMAKAINEI